MKISKILNGYITVSYIGDDSVVLAKRGQIYIYNFFEKKLSFILSLPENAFFFYLFSSKLLFRLFRYGVRCGITISNNELFLVFRKKYYKININDKSFSQVGIVEKGNRPLNILLLNNSKSFVNGIYYGEYFDNPNKNDVNIWHLNIITFEKRIAYTFPKGVLNHIHNLIYDKIEDKILVLAGDFEHSASMWVVEDNFKKINLINSSQQIFRACIGFKISSSEFIYATDSQLEKNSIRKFIYKDNLWLNEIICYINGPAIYGTRCREDFIFSTSVEGVSSFINGFWKYLDNKIGPGVLDKHAHIVIGNEINGFNTIVNYKKDFWPFILFQFGAIIFPSGVSSSNFIATHHVALEPYDICTVIYSLD